ncbi:hypothetical protein Tco_0078323 [Tanacetum coccineum]
MSTLAYVDSETITQADGAQSSRVPVLIPDDPYVGVRQAHLTDTDTESNPEEAPSEAEESQPLGSRVPLTDKEFEASKPSGTRTDSFHSSTSSDSTTPLSPDHPLTQVSPTPTPTRASFHHSTFRKRYRSSYKTPSPSPSLTLPVQKRYRGTSELILDTDSEGDELGDEDTDKDGEDESSNADDERERLDDEGHGLDDEGHGLDDEGHGLDDKDHGLDDEGHGLDDEDHGLEDEGLGLEEEDEVVPEGHQQVVPVINTVVGKPLGLGYGALRRRELAAGEDQAPSTFEVDLKDGRVYTDILAYVPLAAPVQTPPSLEWSSGSLPISPSSFVVPLPIASLVATLTATISVDEDQFIEVGVQLDLHGSILQDHTQRLDALPPTLVVDIDRDVRELYTRSGAVIDEIFSQRYMLRSLEREQERVAVTFRALWRPVLALEAWAGQTDAQRAALCHVIYDIQKENHDLRMQLAEERRERLELADCVARMDRRQESREE